MDTTAFIKKNENFMSLLEYYEIHNLITEDEEVLIGNCIIMMTIILTLFSLIYGLGNYALY